MGCHARLQEIFPKGTELACLMSPALAGGFFTTSATITTDTVISSFSSLCMSLMLWVPECHMTLSRVSGVMRHWTSGGVRRGHTRCLVTAF